MVDEVSEETLNQILSYVLLNKNQLIGREHLKSSILETEELSHLKDEIFVPAFDKYLKETCNKNINEWSGYKLNGWLVSYGEGQSLDYHNHKGSQLSSVLYIMSEEKDIGGEVCFTDPRQNANRGYDLNFNSWFETFKMKPKVGQLVVFPSFLYHYVTTYQSNIRMAIPVDCFLYNSNK